MATDQQRSIMKTVQKAETRSRWVAALFAGGRSTAGEKLLDAAQLKREDGGTLVLTERDVDGYDGMGFEVIGVGCQVEL